MNLWQGRGNVKILCQPHLGMHLKEKVISVLSQKTLVNPRPILMMIKKLILFLMRNQVQKINFLSLNQMIVCSRHLSLLGKILQVPLLRIQKIRRMKEFHFPRGARLSQRMLEVVVLTFLLRQQCFQKLMFLWNKNILFLAQRRICSMTMLKSLNMLLLLVDQEDHQFITHVLHKHLINNYLLVDMTMRREVHISFLRVLCQVDPMETSIDCPVTIHLCHQCHLQFHLCLHKILIQFIGSHPHMLLGINHHLVILHNLLMLVRLVHSRGFRLNICLRALMVHHQMIYPMQRPSSHGTHFQ
uniref:Uncharacterized protein n=1 Tax=Arundo donax TaxID=35708 RepID=A0A0A9EUX3_ARUDO